MFSIWEKGAWAFLLQLVGTTRRDWLRAPNWADKLRLLQHRNHLKCNLLGQSHNCQANHKSMAFYVVSKLLKTWKVTRRGTLKIGNTTINEHFICYIVKKNKFQTLYILQYKISEERYTATLLIYCTAAWEVLIQSSLLRKAKTLHISEGKWKISLRKVFQNCSVRMNTFISENIKASTTKFCFNVSYNCAQLK